MAAYFLDTSALVKRYVVETGSGWVHSLTNVGSGNSCWILELTKVELLAAVYRRSRDSTLSLAEANQAELAFRADVATGYRSIAVSSRIIRLAMTLVSRHPLRAYDSVQLASAIETAHSYDLRGVPSPIFICADDQLNLIAAAEGLTVDNPNDHP
jgi:predicted nucleic acid-binding protein